MRLAGKIQRINLPRLTDAFVSASTQFDGKFAPEDLGFLQHLTDQERETVLQVSAVSKARTERSFQRQLMRTHRGIQCAAGCGTRFGKRRSDHNILRGGILDGEGIEGGWHCPSDELCREHPTGDHYCGMCTEERRSAAAAVDDAAL